MTKAILFLAGFMTFLMPACALAKSVALKEGPPEWFQCQSDDQCVVKEVSCSGCIAINKDYSSHADELGVPACLASLYCDLQHSRAVCQNHKCILVSGEKSQ